MGEEDEKKLKEKVKNLSAQLNDLQRSANRGVGSINNLFSTSTNYIEGSAISIGNVKDTIETLLGQITTATTFINDKGIDLAPFKELEVQSVAIQQEFGISKNRLREFRVAIADVSGDLIRMGLDQEDVIRNMTDVMKSLSTTSTISSDGMKDITAASKITNVNVGVLAKNFREVGVSIHSVGNEMKEVINIAKNAGISVTAVSELVVSNLKQMNLYNFDTGVKGLSQMAVTSERLGISMDRVFDFAEKIFNPEGAIEMAAGLQRLGVTASGLLDPLRAMDLAMNDPKGLQDEILNITKEFTRFNEANGKFEIMPGSKRRLREIAKEMGIPADELAQMSIKAADFDRKMQQITFPSLVTDQETKEMIAGMAQLKDGRAEIAVTNRQTGEVTYKTVDQLTASDIESLKETQEEGSKTIEELAIDQLNVLQQINKNIAGGIQDVRYGAATADPLDRIYQTTLRAVSAGVRTPKEVGLSPSKVRDMYTEPFKEIEKSIIGVIQKGENITGGKLIEILGKFGEEGERAFNGIQKVIHTGMDNFKNVFEESYNRTINTNSKVDINMNINGNDNTRNMDMNAIQTSIIDFLTNSEEGKNLLRKALSNGTQPSSTQTR